MVWSLGRRQPSADNIWVYMMYGWHCPIDRVVIGQAPYPFEVYTKTVWTDGGAPTLTMIRKNKHYTILHPCWMLARCVKICRQQLHRTVRKSHTLIYAWAMAGAVAGMVALVILGDRARRIRAPAVVSMMLPVYCLVNFLHGFLGDRAKENVSRYKSDNHSAGRWWLHQLWVVIGWNE